MNRRPDASLDTEERELAGLLGRAGPHGEPSPALDARILAAAHEAVAGSAPARRRPRWPWALGVAASMLLAVGIVWQQRPQLQAPMAASEADRMAGAAAPADSSETPMFVPSPAEEAEMAPADAASQDAAPPASPAPLAEVAASDAPAAPVKMLAPPVQEAVEARPADTPADSYSPPPAAAARSAPKAAPAYAPPAPPAPPPPVVEAAPEAPAPEASLPLSARERAATVGGTTAVQRQQADPELQADMAAKAETNADRNASLDSVVVTGSRMARGDGAVEDDAQLSRRKWIKRIQQRLDDGDTDGARASLRLFVDKYTEDKVPQDLRFLLEE